MSFITTIVASIIKSMAPSSLETTELMNSICSNILKNIGLVIILSIMLASLVLMGAYGIGYYLVDQGLFPIQQVIAIVVSFIASSIVLCCIFLKCNIKNLTDGKNESNDEDKKSSHYNIIESFMNGFNSKN